MTATILQHSDQIVTAFAKLPRSFYGSAYTKEVALVLAGMMNKDSDWAAWPYVCTIAEEVGCSERTVRSAIARLEEKKVYNVERREHEKVKNWNLASVYTLGEVGRAIIEQSFTRRCSPVQGSSSNSLNTDKVTEEIAPAIVEPVGFKSIIDMVPSFRNASDKELSAMFKEFGYYYGNSRMLAYFSHIEDFGNNAVGNIGALASQSAQTALRFSGLSLIDQLSRQSALIGWTRRLEKQVKSGRTGAKDFQLSEMGWKPETYEKIFGYIKAHGMKMDNWRLPDGRQDLATIEQFTNGAHKVVSENIARMMAGESNDWVDGPWGSMFLQFRKIVYAAYNKSLLRGLSKPDAIMASNLVASLVGALVVNEMRNAVKTSGMGEDERDEYLKKYGLRYAIMNDGDLLQAVHATLTYTPAGGPLLELLSLFSSQFLGIDLRGRHTGGPETFLQVPSIQLAENLMRGSAGLAFAPFQEDPNWKDIGRRARAVATAQNWYLTHPVVNILSEE